jgi:hypothetical protein
MDSYSIDLEATGGASEFLDGYVDFAEFIASDADLSIFRQFKSLASRNLLYLEAELQLLQFELQEIDKTDQELLKTADDSEGKTKTEQAVRAWECFKQQAKTDPKQRKKLEMIMRLRRAMEEYGTLLSVPFFYLRRSWQCLL